jgi:hypothetical protein
MGGGVQARWCYPFERCLKTLRKKCKNKGKIEASIASAFTLEETSNFTTSYYDDTHNPPPRYNADENEWTLSLFRGQLGRDGGSTTKPLSNMEWRKIMLYVLTNLEELDPYIV